MVRGVVYEVASTDKEGSAFALAFSILGGKFSIINGGSATLDSAIRLKTSSIDAVFSTLSSDSRFNVISKASVHVASGDTGRFNSGQEVPVLGAVSYPSGAGQALQDVQYRNSGATFEYGNSQINFSYLTFRSISGWSSILRATWRPFAFKRYSPDKARNDA